MVRVSVRVRLLRRVVPYAGVEGPYLTTCLALVHYSIGVVLLHRAQPVLPYQTQLHVAHACLAASVVLFVLCAHFVDPGVVVAGQDGATAHGDVDIEDETGGLLQSVVIRTSELDSSSSLPAVADAGATTAPHTLANGNATGDTSGNTPSATTSAAAPNADPAAASSSASSVYCARCELHRPPGAKHCDSCGVCVRAADHHCGFIGNCVGEGNARFFHALLVVAGVGMHVAAVGCVMRLRASGSWSDARSYAIAVYAFSVFPPCVGSALGGMLSLVGLAGCLADVCCPTGCRLRPCGEACGGPNVVVESYKGWSRPGGRPGHVLERPPGMGMAGQCTWYCGSHVKSLCCARLRCRRHFPKPWVY